MSALALLYNRTDEPAVQQGVGAMLSAMDHRGPDGCDAVVIGNAALGHQHFWTTPEEIGERQPLTDPDCGISIAFDGRLDNRDYLLRTLRLNHDTSQPLSDAALVLRCYLQWGEVCFERLLGAFAIVLIDERVQSVLLARDGLGERTLFYYLDNSVLVAASEAAAVLAYPAAPRDVDEDTLVRLYAIDLPQAGHSMFKHVHEVLPGQALVIIDQHVRAFRHWQIDLDRRIRYRREDEYAEHFRDLLTNAVRNQLRGADQPALLMSGGYDSASLAVIAAQNTSQPLTTVSWLFDELTDCNERPAIDVINQHIGARPVQFSADHLYPLSDWSNWPHDPSWPLLNAHRALKMRAYRAAASSGARVVLTGAAGDDLFAGSAHWLHEMLHDGRIGAAAVSVARLVRSTGWRGAWQNGALRFVARSALEPVPGVKQMLKKRARPIEKAWLTPYARSLLAQQERWTAPEGARRPSQVETLVSDHAAFGPSAETYYAALAGIDVRSPHRDRRLIEFMLAIPAYLLNDGQRTKAIVYRAMAGLLPDTVRQKRSVGNLTPLFLRGCMEREHAALRRILAPPDAEWRRYVQPDALEAVMRDQWAAGAGTFVTLLPWFCLALECWNERWATNRNYG
jgi:asparagine synthase (glutamine-hydrolysing)